MSSEEYSAKRGFLMFVLGFIVSVGFYILFMEYPQCEPLIHTTKPQVHLPRNGFLLVAVMTTRARLETRAKAIFETWGNRVPGKLLFFVGGNQPYHGKLPVVVLKDIEDTVYPLIKKSFAMIDYLSDMMNNYEWFMRADDDMYLKIEHLEKYLRTIDSSKTLFIGHPGYNKQEEMGKLGMLMNLTYCMGGPGVVFTKSALLTVKHHIPTCLSRTISKREDVDLGRCLLTHARIPCARSKELFSSFFHFTGNKLLKTAWITDERATTLHPVKEPSGMYHWDSYFTLKDKREKIQDLQDSIDRVNKLLPDKAQTLEDEVGDDGDEDRRWRFMIYNERGSINERFDALSTIKAWKAVWHETNMKGWWFSPVTYQRLMHGKIMENVIIKTSDNNISFPVRTIQRLAGIEFRETKLPYTPPTIWMIVPLHKKYKQYVAFVQRAANAVKNYEGRLNLRIVLYIDEDGEYKKTQSFSRSIMDKLNLNVIFINDTFNRGNAKDWGMKGITNDSLLTFVDVDMAIDEYFLKRVVLNTVYHERSYFAVSFSQYDPKVVCFDTPKCNFTVKHFKDQFGFWRFLGYGVVSIYKEDFLTVGGFDLNIDGWGLEDVDLYDKNIKRDFGLFRALDTSLVHIYHDKHCEGLGDREPMCADVRNSHYGTIGTLYNVVDKLKLVDV